LLILLGLIILLFIAIQTSPVQNWLARKAASKLSKDLNTEVSVKGVSFSLLNRMDIEGVLVRDRQKDTLLYAGALKVRITDWFIFKDQADLKYIGLEDAVIHTSRTDSVWNYQFIVDHFSSPADPKKTSATTTKKGLELDLKKVDFKNVTLVQEDKWRGETMRLKFGSLLLNGNKMDFNKGVLDIADLTLDKTVFGIYNYTGNRKTRSSGKGFSLDIGVQLKIGKLELNNTTFINDKETERGVYPYFDGAHMIISKLNGTIKDLSFNNDTIRGKLDIAARERSGFELKKLKADFKFTTTEMEFANLDLQTPKSRIRDYYRMEYKDFNDDMSEFTDSVLLTARFKQANIHSDDIAFFAPDLTSWKKEISASGTFRGIVNDLKGNNAAINIGNSSVTGDIGIKGVTDINTAFISLNNATVVTNYKELSVYVPQIKEVKTPDLESLGTIRYYGNFNGTVNKFIAKGSLNTSLGNLTTDISMNIPSKGQPVYRGSINTQRFNLGKFLDINGLGYVSMNGKINGSGFNKNNLKTSFDGNIGELNYGAYTYRNITTNGMFQKGAFNGEVKIDDPNLNFTSNINIDFNGAQPRFIVLGDVARANLQLLGFTKENFGLAGLFDLDFTGTNVDNFIGYAKLINASLTHDSTRLSFDSLAVQTEYVGNDKLLSIRSNEMDAFVKGQYNILDLPNSIQSYLHRYYPSYISAPSRVPQDQRFTIDISTRNIADYINIIDPKLGGFDNASITGAINTTRPDSGFSLTTNVPYFRYDKTAFSGVQFRGFGDAAMLNLKGEVDLVTVGDSLYFPNTRLSILSNNDLSYVSIKTKANNTLNEADLNASVTTLEDGVQINFKPSSFVLNDARWTLEKEGELVLRKHYMSAKDVKFTQGFQEITVSTRMPDGGNVNELVVNLKNIHLGDFIHFVTKDPQMQGLVSGEVVVTDMFDQLSAHADLQTEAFQLDNDSMGRVNLLADYSKRTGKVSYKVVVPNEPYQLSLEGIFDTKDSTGAPLTTMLKLRGTRITFINRFLSSVFSGIDGYATGDLQMTGNINRPKLMGKVKLKNAGMKVNYTQVYYNIDEADLDFRDDRIDFGQFTLRDKYGHTGIARGVLYATAFQNMRFDFDMSTNKMLLLDTRVTDNENFYGRAIGRASLTIRGPEEDIRMNIVGEINDTSHISIPTSDAKESADADFIVFKQPGKEIKAIAKSTTNVTVDLDITATNKADIDLILDPLAGDVLKAKGNGRLRIHAGTIDKVTMNGRYNVEQGSYDFNLQSVIKRPFTIDKNGSNYIEWTGDPYEAEIHIDAMYEANNVSLNDLIANKFNFTNANSYRGAVYVIAEMRDKLSQPKISFRIDFPSTSGIMNDYEFTAFLKQLQANQNEMNKQVTYLLVFNTFAPYGEGRNIAQNLSSLVYNSISQFVNRQINKLVSDWLYKATGIKFDINASAYNSSSLLGGAANAQNVLTSLDRLGLGVKLWKGFLNDRIIINLGTSLDLNLNRPGAAAALQNSNFQFLPDFSVEFVLDQSRRLRMILFQRNTLDYNSSGSTLVRRNRTGISLTYTKESDNIF